MLYKIAKYITQLNMTIGNLMSYQAPRGTNDILPQQAHAFARIWRIATDVFSKYGYAIIATPTFENTEVFVRGIGEATDVIGKEMFHVLSMHAADKLAQNQPLKSDEKLSLRPEGTAGVARAVVQHNLVPPGAPTVKLWYKEQMFRHERPQKGRLREFNQIGAECLGATEPSADAELIIMLMSFFEALGIPQNSMRLLINSMGDDNCRPAYRDKVRRYILDHSAELCDECNRRADTNPLRAFDCKNPECRQVMHDAPKITDLLCPECQDHYIKVKQLLDAASLQYQEDPRLVRGLDYYTRTVFEVQVDAGLGSQNAIGGGGRYDKLLAEFGGKPTPGLGFAVGLERIQLVLEALEVAQDETPRPTVFVAAVDDDSRAKVFEIAQQFRSAGIATELDHQKRSLKSQFKVADKTGAPYCLVVGPEEISAGEYNLRSMTDHQEQLLSVEELIIELQKK
jgi:histidyl-tRNA synthetase